MMFKTFYTLSEEAAISYYKILKSNHPECTVIEPVYDVDKDRWMIQIEYERAKFRGRLGNDIVASLDYGPKAFGLWTEKPTYSPNDICTLRLGCETCSITAEILRKDFYDIIDYLYKDIHDIKEG